MDFTRCACLAVCALLAASRGRSEGQDALRRDTQQALAKAVSFFRQHVSTQGGYLWRYRDDLSLREGEAKTGDSTVWVQPPGTPSVGEALLAAWRASGEQQYLDAARDAAQCLVRGQ